jgi:uncharacterized protein YeaO (DUF488 family)
VGVIALSRVHDHDVVGEEPRFLVERLWPRGIRGADLRLTDWIREVGPSDDLRRWFGHDPEKWDEFRRRYVAELDEHPEAWARLADAASTGTITLLYSSRDTRHNNALVLGEYLDERLRERRTDGSGTRDR